MSLSNELAALRSLQLAYLAALTLPHSIRRIELQTLLTKLLGEIADITGEEEELIQNAHEAVLAFRPKGSEWLT